MINVNLLPQELRRSARTPKILFLTIAAGTTMSVTMGVGVFWLWMNVNGLERRVADRTIQVNALQAEAGEVDRLHDDIALFKDREQAIIEIKSQRTFWGLKLHQLMLSTPTEIWLTSLEMTTLSRAEHTWDKGSTQTGGLFEFDIFARGTDVATIANYRSELAGNQTFYSDLIQDTSVFPDNFFGDFLDFEPLDFERAQLSAYEQSQNLKSKIAIQLKPRFKEPEPVAPTAGGR